MTCPLDHVLAAALTARAPGDSPRRERIMSRRRLGREQELLSEDAAEVAQCPVDPGLDCSDRHAENRGGFGARPVLVVDQVEDGSVGAAAGRSGAAAGRPAGG